MATKPPQGKYQVFISSTFTDLREERERVSWEILKLRHIPAGMENFTAKSERGWKTIQRVIDVSDYYVLILAGRYGSVDSTWGQSWTHHEYDYASKQGVPILAFVRELDAIPASQIDKNRSRLDRFIAEIKKNHLVTPWREKEDLASSVNTALTTQIADDIEDDKQRPGWYRGDSLPPIPPLVTAELARLSAEEARLRKELAESQAAVRQLQDAKTLDITTILVSLDRYSYQLNGHQVSLRAIFPAVAHSLATGESASDLDHTIVRKWNLDPKNTSKSLFRLTGYRIMEIVAPLIILKLIHPKIINGSEYYYLTDNGIVVAATMGTSVERLAAAAL